MTKLEFENIANAHGMTGTSRRVCELVVVEGLSNAAAAEEVGCTRSLVTQALSRFNREVCECCGQTVR